MSHTHDEQHDLGLLHDLDTLRHRARFGRREMLGALGGVGAGIAALSIGGGRAMAASVLIPEETAGPYPADGSNGPNVLTESGIVRSDIRSSFGSMSGTAPGVPLTITLQLTDVTNGGVLRNAAVYLWHCDQAGLYSLYSSGATDQNYLRGVQVSGDDGTVTFTTIFPACYTGRWPHAHFEVYPSVDSITSAGNAIATSQVAFPQSICDAVYATSGYEASVSNLAGVSLANDNVFGNDDGVLQLATIGGSIDAGLTATLAVGVDADGAGTVATDLTVTPTSSPASVGTASAYVALTAPQRLLDTRPGTLTGYTSSKPAAGSAFSLSVLGQGSIPSSGVSAVVLNMTVAEPEAPGYVTVWPSGARPLASSINVDTASQTRANLVTVPVADDGAVMIYAHSATHVIADAVGYYTPATSSRSGRTQFVAPSRIVDTRTGSRVAAGGTLDVQVLGQGGVPTTGVAAVILNVTATDTAAAGFVTIAPGVVPPSTSNVNFDGIARTVANQAIAPVADNGTVTLYASAATHLVVDVFGWITDATAADSADGLMIPVSPYRVADTRTLTGFGAGSTLHVLAAASGAAAAGMSGLDLNVTATNPGAPGFVTVWPEGTRPTVSNVNVTESGQTIANHAACAVGSAGGIDVYALSDLDVVVDVTGWYV